MAATPTRARHCECDHPAPWWPHGRCVLCGCEPPDAVALRWRIASLVAARELEQWHAAPDVEITDPAASIRWCCECSVVVLPEGTDQRRVHCDSCHDRFRAEGKLRRALTQ